MPGSEVLERSVSAGRALQPRDFTAITAARRTGPSGRGSTITLGRLRRRRSSATSRWSNVSERGWARGSWSQFWSQFVLVQGRPRSFTTASDLRR
jgi:hypothetical protein